MVTVLDLCEASLIDLGGQEQARWGGLYMPAGSNRLSEARPVPNHSSDESNSDWFRRWARLPIGSAYAHIGLDPNLGEHRASLSVVHPVSDVQGTVQGALQLALSLDRLFARMQQGGARSWWPSGDGRRGCRRRRGLGV